MAVITQYNAICNLGSSISEIYSKALLGDNSCFKLKDDILKDKHVRLAEIDLELPKINNPDYDLRCNRLLLKCLDGINLRSVFDKYSKDEIALICATTNTGVEEFRTSKNINHAKISNPAEFLSKHLGLKSFNTSVSTACSSGAKAFLIALDILNSNVSKAAIVAGVDSISSIPLFGFDSLGILSENETNPFSKNRDGINIAEAVSVFVLEKDSLEGINILSIAENTDTYHATTPDPSAKEAINCIKEALNSAKLRPDDIQYINLHATGTIANDKMEAAAINEIFKAEILKNKVLASSTKPLTGHALGAAASIEIALCSKLLDDFRGEVFPHVFDGNYDVEIKKINLAKLGETKLNNLQNCLSLSFGFGGTNTAIILSKIKKNGEE